MKSFLRTALFTIAILTCCGAASAQSPVQQQQAKGITIDGLAEIFQSMGHKVQVNQGQGGKNYLTFSLKENDGWSYQMEADIAKGSIWLISPLSVKVTKSMTAEKALQLLELNNFTAPCFLSFRSFSGQLCMSLEVPAPNPTAQLLKQNIGMLCDTIKKTSSVWNVVQNEADKADEAQVAQQPGTTGQPAGKIQAAPQVQPILQPAPQPAMAKLAGTGWAGKENLGGYGELGFAFKAGNQAVMIDRDGAHPGTYAVKGNSVTLTFFDGGCVYQGTLQGQTLSGAATNGKANWQFQVQLTNAN